MTIKKQQTFNHGKVSGELVSFRAKLFGLLPEMRDAFPATSKQMRAIHGLINALDETRNQLDNAWSKTEPDRLVRSPYYPGK
jgi:hypothetical protein